MTTRRSRISLSLLALAASLALSGCRPSVEEPAAAATEAPEAVTPASSEPERSIPRAAQRELAGDWIRGKVLETMDAGSYTYVRVDAGGDLAWAAAPKFAVSIGDEVTVPTSMPMPGHESKTLGRTFDLVYFCSRIEIAGQDPQAQAMATAHAQTRPAAVAPADLAGIVKAEGGYTVADVHGQAKRLSGQEVVLRGRVVKFSSGIMGRNWLHVQDGSGEGDSADLTVTTQGTAEVGDLALIEGRVATDQDFGYGYAYAVLVQDASITVE